MTIFGVRCEFSNELIMKDFLLKTFLILVSLLTMPVVSYAQRYEADYLIGNYIRAYRTDADGSVSDIYGNRYNSEDESRDAWRNMNATAR